MDCPPQSPDLSPTENLWSIIKRKVYKNGRDFGSKKVHWEIIKDVSAKIQPEIIQKLTNSIDARLVKLLKNCGKRISSKINNDKYFIQL